jgi:protein ImuB
MVACAFIPSFELCVLAKGRPELWNETLAVADFAARPPRVKVTTPAAHRLGIQAGQLCSQVRACYPEVRFVAPDETLLAAETRAILLALGELSPLLDTGDAGAFFLGFDGLEKLYPSERAFAGRIRGRLEQLGYQARVAVAERPFAAWVLARQEGSALRCLSGIDEVAFLDSLPLSLLNLPEAATQLCELLGVKTAGALLALPAGSFTRRLGQVGADLEKLCRGEGLTVWPQTTKVPLQDPRVELDLDLPEENREPLLFVVKSLLDRLLTEVAQSRRALSELTLTLTLDDRSACAQSFPSEDPSLRTALFLDLIRLWLEGRPLTAPVVSLRLVATKTAPAGRRQLQLFHRKEEQAREALGTVLSRLCAAFGREAVVRPVLADVHRPEERLHWAFFDSHSEDDVSLRGTEAGMPLQGRSGAWAAAGEPLVLQLYSEPRPIESMPPVSERAGPFRLCGEWWHRPFDRSYYWLALPRGEKLWVFRDERQGGLFVQGVVD